MLTAPQSSVSSKESLAPQNRYLVPPVFDPLDNANAWGGGGAASNSSDADIGNTHRLLEAIEQQKRVVEQELTRLKEQTKG